MSSTKLLRSPLRYPGGKHRLARMLVSMLPQDSEEYREPFVGGGHVFVRFRQLRPDVKIWINDNNPDLIAFWKEAQRDSEALSRRILPLVDVEDRRGLFNALKNMVVESQEDRAFRFFVLNRLSYGGKVHWLSFSPDPDNFNKSCVLAVAPLSRILEGALITCGDYEHVVSMPGEGVALYCDPPYKTNARIYGSKNFDFGRFFDVMKRCNHRWIITIDAWDGSLAFARRFWRKEESITYDIKPKRAAEIVIANYAVDGFSTPD